MNDDKLTPRDDALWPGASGSPLRGLRFEHDYYSVVKEWAWDQIDCNDEPIIVVVIGGTGTGKTTLRKQIEEEIVARLSPELAADRSIIPYVTGETVFNPRSGVDWAGLFRGWLSCGGEILIDRKITPDGSEKPGTLPTLLQAVMAMLRYRRPAIAMVDEASVLLGNQSSTTGALKTNVNYLRGICNLSQTHLGFFGDYNLSGLMLLSGQLNRRIHYAHLPPYPDLCENFRKVLRDFEEGLGKAGFEAELTRNAELMFASSLGCVGLLRRWLLKAYVQVRKSRKPITRAVLLETVEAEATLSIWRSELKEGADRIAWMKSENPMDVFDPRN